MADETESKPSFWTTMPGLLTAGGGVIVAITGLITALYSTGAISSKPGSNSAPTSNAAVLLASVPAAVPSISTNAEFDKYKQLSGKWEIIEEYPQNTEEVVDWKFIWQFDGEVSGNKFTLTNGKLISINDDKNLRDEDDILNSSYEFTLEGEKGHGKQTQEDEPGVRKEHDTSMKLRGFSSFIGGFTAENGKVVIKGHKL